ncbi:alpha/beta hydrolase [soil metagenome]
MKRVGRVLAAIVIVIALGATAFGVWAHSVMPGDRTAALAAWNDPGLSVTSTDHSIVLTPTAEATGIGLVFIPGAKVDPYAYLNKLSGIVESGVTVVITKPTLNLAFFDTRRLSVFQADAPSVAHWYVGGHSLGGVKACLLAQTPGVQGLVLFGSYCANDVSDTGLKVVSISGSRDGLSTPAKITDAAHNLPKDTIFDQIAGANHAAFGDYGTQPGDGTATISSATMRAELTAELVSFFAGTAR